MFKFLLVLFTVAVVGIQAKQPKHNNQIKIGYFHGGRTMLLYRAQYFKDFKREGVDVRFITKYLNSKKWYDFISKRNKGVLDGKATGIELIDLLLEGKVELSVTGEAAFLRSCEKGEPIVAIAELGADETNNSGHAIGLKKGIKVNGPKDLEKIVWGTRRSSGGDDVFLKEFLLQSGVDLSKVKIISSIDDNKLEKFVRDGTITGGYFHLMDLRELEVKDLAYLYRKLDWVNPAFSHALLVTTPENLKIHKANIKKMLRGYIKRVRFEHDLPLEKKKDNYLHATPAYRSAYEMATDYKGMNLPQYRALPFVRSDLEADALKMFLRHGYIKKNFDINRCIDNSILDEIQHDIDLKEKSRTKKKKK